MRVVVPLLFLVCSFPSASFADRVVRSGNWGGAGILMRVHLTTTSVVFDCAHGRINGAIVINRDGHFDMTGIYVEDGPGPIRAEDDRIHQALYSGDVSGGVMTMTVTVVETNVTVGTFTLSRGAPAAIFTCL